MKIVPHLEVLFAACLLLAAGCGSPGKTSGDGEEETADGDMVSEDSQVEEGPDTVGDGENDVGPEEPLPAPDLEVFSRRGFDFVLPGDVMSPGERVESLSFQAAAGEREPVSFIVGAGEDLSMTAEVGALSCNDGGVTRVIEASKLDLRVVKVWKQSGLGRKVDRPEGIDVPELLVYDDAQELHALWPFPEESFVDGTDGGGVRLDYRAFLSFPTTDMSLDGGTAAFTFRPDWSSADERETRVLFSLRAGAGDEILLFHQGTDTASSLRLALRGSGANAVCVADTDWTAGAWHTIALTWSYGGGPGSGACELSVDGTWADPAIGADPVSAMPPVFTFGSGADGSRAAGGTFDELRVYGYAAARAEIEAGDLDPALLALAADFEDSSGTAALAHEMRSNQMSLPTPSHELRTEVPAGTLKQFWLTATVDGDTAPCDYSGSVTLLADGRAPFEIPITLTVLPFALDPPSAFHMFYLSFSLDPEDVQYVDEEHLRVYLQDLRGHGVTGVKFRPQDEYIARAIEIACEEGMDRVVVDEPPVQENVDALTESPCGYAPYFYGIDEANGNPRLIAHIRKSYEIHDAGGLVATALWYETAERLRDPADSVYDLRDEVTGQTFRDLGWIHEAVDMPNYHSTVLTLSDAEEVIDSRDQDLPLLAYIEALRSGAAVKNPGIVETYYWQPWVQIPNMNRQMAGFFLGASGLDGCWPWGYLGVGFPGNDVFTDEDNPVGDLRDFMTVHPSAEGPIPTTQWEAFREGVDDLRYLATLARLLDERQDDMPGRVAAIREELDAVLDFYVVPWYAQRIEAARFEEDRARIASWIIELL